LPTQVTVAQPLQKTIPKLRDQKNHKKQPHLITFNRGLILD
jgi:hypothetical protein